MPITIGSNIAALKAERQLGQSSSALGKVYERLSSGQRINHASDDAAGLAISESLRSDKKVFTQALRNLNDGTSVINIADGALEQFSNIVIRIRELAEQSASGTFSNTQRKALDAEAQSLAKEYFRIAQTTKFNGRNLFDANFQELRVQAGLGTDGSVVSGFGGALGTGTLGSSGSYNTETQYSIGVNTGDLNNDGILDLVTSGVDAFFSNGYASVRLGIGDGTFAASRSYAAETGGSYRLTLGDVNNDGVLDLFTAGVTSGGVGITTLRLGDGKGSFGTATTYAAETNISYDVQLADLNNDGNLDVITAGANATDGYSTIRLGNGNGTFGSAVSYLQETAGTNGVRLGDLNGDGILDLVSVGQGDDGDAHATVRIGNGNGTFGGATSYITESLDSQQLALGDINGDGNLDLVSAGESDTSTGSATVRLGTGTGSFGAATSFATESAQSIAMSLGDLNGDGFLDLVTAGVGSFSQGFASVRLGNGRGSFEAATSYIADTGGSQGLTLGDLNGDGVLDVITAGFGATSGSATVRLGQTVNGVSPLLSFSLLNRTSALQALAPLERKLEQISSQRAIVGAFQSRINAALGAISSTTENYAAAESRIRDTDIAADSANLTRLKILQTAASSVLAQANQAPALALQLLN